MVPVETASNKTEYAARTIRPKIERLMDQFLVELKTTPVKKDAGNIAIDGLDLSDIDAVCDSLSLDRSVPTVNQFFQGGTSQAKARLRRFLDDSFDRYDANRNQPQTDDVTHLSMSLHFGQISPVAIALEARGNRSRGRNLETLLEELIIRRELAHNFVAFTADYDRYSCLPDWAQKTLDKHRDDEREYVYTREDFAAAKTHDPYWNAAMQEMRHTGYMHNAMRMYWGKKILEWTGTPEYAYRVALDLNNTYFLDGRDANSFANVGWLFGLHDRPWQERPIYGTVRCMTAGGLERKCDVGAYLRKVERLVAEADAT